MPLHLSSLQTQPTTRQRLHRSSSGLKVTATTWPPAQALSRKRLHTLPVAFTYNVYRCAAVILMRHCVITRFFSVPPHRSAPKKKGKKTHRLPCTGFKSTTPIRTSSSYWQGTYRNGVLETSQSWLRLQQSPLPTHSSQGKFTSC